MPSPLLLRRGVLFILLLLARAASAATTTTQSVEDLYQLLGVSRSASQKEIKAAYRRKALDTHPDKNKDVPPEEAAAAFHKVVQAFEILSDEQSRRHYDRTGQQHQHQQRQQSTWTWHVKIKRQTTYQYHPPKLKDKWQVQQAQSRVLHLVSLQQLKNVMLDEETGALERSLLIAFYTPTIQDHLNDEMVYPYPFAAMSEQGIWWEDLLQTTSVRVGQYNELTQFFGISIDEMEAPIFVFGKRGQSLADQATWPRLSTRNRQEFHNWLWQQIAVTVEFVNQHDAAVEIYWIHTGSTKAELKMILQPGQVQKHVTKLSHEWWARDARVDTFVGSPGRHTLTDNSTWARWKITSDKDGQVLVVPQRSCFDLSGHCLHWHSRGECRKNPRFMEQYCAQTCQVCQPVTASENSNTTDKDDDGDDTTCGNDKHDEL